MFIDCHTHTSRHSSCSTISPEELCTLAVERGLHALVLTEHMYRWSEEEVQKLQARFPAIKLYSGVEVTMDGGYHVVLIGPTGPYVHEKNWRMSELLKMLGPERESSFIFIAHPFRYDILTTKALDSIFRAVDAIEISSVNIIKTIATSLTDRFAPTTHKLYEAARSKYSLAGIYNTDCHSPPAIGTIMNYVDVTELPDNERDLALLLKKHNLVERQNTPLLKKYLQQYQNI